MPITTEEIIMRIRAKQQEREVSIKQKQGRGLRPDKDAIKMVVQKMRTGRMDEIQFNSDFTLNQISMVSDPETECVIKDPTFAFDYAMQLLEKKC